MQILQAFYIFCNRLFPVSKHIIGCQSEHIIFKYRICRSRRHDARCIFVVLLGCHRLNHGRLSRKPIYLPCKISPVRHSLAGAMEQAEIVRRKQIRNCLRKLVRTRRRAKLVADNRNLVMVFRQSKHVRTKFFPSP